MRKFALAVPLGALLFACGGRVASTSSEGAGTQTTPTAPTSTATQSPSFPAPTSTGSSSPPPPASGNATCSFQIIGSATAWVSNTNAAAYPAGGDIPFIMIECASGAGNASVQIQWIPASNGGPDQAGGVWLTYDDYEYTYGAGATCSAYGFINGVTYANLGRQYQVGDRISADFSCTNLSNEQIAGALSVSGHIDAVITTQPLGGP